MYFDYTSHMRSQWQPNRSDFHNTFRLERALPEGMRWEEHFGLVAYSDVAEFSRRWPYKDDIKKITDEGREIVLLSCAEYPVSAKDRGRHRTSSNYFIGKHIVCSQIDPASQAPAISYRERIIEAEKALRAATDEKFNVTQTPELHAELSEKGEKTWDQLQSLPISLEDAQILAKQLFRSSRAQRGELIVVECTHETLGVAEEVLKICDQEGVLVKFDLRNYAREAIFAKHLSDRAAEGEKSQLALFAQERLQLYDGVFKTLRVANNPDPGIKEFDDSDKNDQLTRYMSPLMQRFRSGDLHYIVTRPPTASDAALDGMEHHAYIKLFMEACDQPWDEIKTAQYVLKEKFDRANKIRITSSDGTDLTLDITGQTFANSVVLKNLPGSEIFSAALREGVNGKLVAKGKFQYNTSGIIEDITLVFEQGRIVSFDARVGRDELAKIIQMDEGKGEGSRYTGEIGIGTNPHLRRHLVNRLLVEKISGSFHIAIGSCYSYTVYDGEPVSLRNGNSSASGVHFDITAVIRGKAGNMELFYGEGNSQQRETVQLNGNWLVPGCEVLNIGWNALPEKQRPKWWKERYPQGYLS